MKLLVRLAIGLYPSWWRERYEAELRALVEESGESWRTALDIAKGAIIMQLTSLHHGARAWLKCVVLGLAVGALAFLVTPLHYVSAMVVEIESAPGTPVPVPGAGGDATMQDLPSRAFSDANMQDLIRRFDLYATPDAGPALDALRRFRSGVSVTLMPPAGESQERLAQGFQRAGSMLVAFNYPDPQKAEHVTSELARLVVEQNLRNREAQAGGDPRTSGDRFRIGPRRELPAERSIKPALAVGFSAALLAAIAVATRRWVRSSPTTDN
jgi:hypothetical protein